MKNLGTEATQMKAARCMGAVAIHRMMVDIVLQRERCRQQDLEDASADHDATEDSKLAGSDSDDSDEAVISVSNDEGWIPPAPD